MIESDLILMSLVIFLPTIFGIVLMFFPKGSEEYMRWWSLLGTAVTFSLSLILFIDYWGMMDVNMALDQAAKEKGQPLVTSLASRADRDAAVTTQTEARKSQDMLGRVPWISRFNIDYYLGVDGISMPLILLTTLLSFLAMLASWKIEKHVRGYCI